MSSRFTKMGFGVVLVIGAALAILFLSQSQAPVNAQPASVAEMKLEKAMLADLDAGFARMGIGLTADGTAEALTPEEPVRSKLVNMYGYTGGSADVEVTFSKAEGATAMKQLIRVHNIASQKKAYEVLLTQDLKTDRIRVDGSDIDLSKGIAILRPEKEKNYPEPKQFPNAFITTWKKTEIMFQVGDQYGSYNFSDVAKYTKEVRLEKISDQSSVTSNQSAVRVTLVLGVDVDAGKTAELDPTYDLNSASNFRRRFEGLVASDKLGWSLTVGDVNNDGQADLVMGAPASDVSNTDVGNVYVFYGGASFPVGTGDINGTWNVRFFLSVNTAPCCGSTNMTLSYLGYSLAIGDLNNDGIVDLAMGASNGYYPGAASAYYGAVYILKGPLTQTGVGNDVNLANPTSNFSVAYINSTSGSSDTLNYRIGTCIAIGNVNGDSFNDLIMGDPYCDINATNDGAVYVVYGAATGTFFPGAGTIRDLATSTNWNLRYEGHRAQDQLGWSVAVGDINASGATTKDIIMSAPGWDGLDTAVRTQCGAVYVALGSASLPSTTGNRRNLGYEPGGTSGYDIRYLGPTAYSAIGHPGCLPMTATGTITSVGTAVNGSGTAFTTQLVVGDFIVAQSQTRVVTAIASNTAMTIDAAFSPDIGSTIAFTYYGNPFVTRSGAGGGHPLDTGDVTGDGNVDLLIGVPLNDYTAANAGSVYVILGGSGIATGNRDLVNQSQ